MPSRRPHGERAHGPGFRRLFLAWTFSNVGNSALYLTMAMWAKDLTGSDSATGLVFLALRLPVFLSPLTGQLADRVSRKRLVVVTNALAARRCSPPQSAPA
ncbi:MAG: hypothetical protein ACRDWI_17120 [Jiangellaceae bacterium]